MSPVPTCIGPREDINWQPVLLQSIQKRSEFAIRSLLIVHSAPDGAWLCFVARPRDISSLRDFQSEFAIRSLLIVHSAPDGAWLCFVARPRDISSLRDFQMVARRSY